MNFMNKYSYHNTNTGCWVVGNLKGRGKGREADRGRKQTRTTQ